MTRKTQKNYIAMISDINKSNVIAEKQINRIKNALARDYDAINELLENNDFKTHYNITIEQSEKGKQYLIKKHLKLNGLQRVTSNADSDFIDMIKALKNGYNYRFTFDGFKEVTNGFFRAYYPIYTLVINDKKHNYYRSYSYFHFNGTDYPSNQCHLYGNIYAYDM